MGRAGVGVAGVWRRQVCGGHLSAAGSSIRRGASSSQSSGLTEAGSGIWGSSTQSAGLESSGSSTFFGGLIGAENAVSSSSEADRTYRTTHPTEPTLGSVLWG